MGLPTIWTHVKGSVGGTSVESPRKGPTSMILASDLSCLCGWAGATEVKGVCGNSTAEQKFKKQIRFDLNFLKSPYFLQRDCQNYVFKLGIQVNILGVNLVFLMFKKYVKLNLDWEG